MEKYWLGAFVTLFSIVHALAADAPATARVRGTVSAFDGKVLTVKADDGKEAKLQVTASTSIVYPKTITLADLKPGEYVGITSTRNNEGRLVAREVHTLASSSNEGHRPMAEPGTTMTNASIARTVKATQGQDLTLEYKGGSQTILVPDGTPIVTRIAADRSLLVPGASVVAIAQVTGDGTQVAQRIEASKDGAALR